MSRATKTLTARRWKSSRRKVTAVDWDARHLWLTEAEVGGGRVRVLQTAREAIPGDVDISDPAALGELLGRTLRAAKMARGHVVMAVPRREVMLRQLELPPFDSVDELAALVAAQLRKETSLDDDTQVVDFVLADDAAQPTAEAEGGVRVTAVIVRQSVVDFYRQLAAAAQVKLRQLTLRSDVRRHALPQGESHEAGPQIVLDLFDAEVELEVIVDGDVALSRSVAVGPATAEGQTRREEDGGGADAATWIGGVVGEATRLCDSYEWMGSGQGPGAAVVAGDTGVEGHVAAQISEQLDIPCGVYAAEGTVQLAPGAAPRMTTLGMVLSDQADALRTINFLAPKRARGQRVGLRVPLAAAVAVLLLVVGVLAGSAQLEQKRRELAETRRQFDELQEAGENIELLGRRVKAVDQWLDARQPWLDHWTRLSERFPAAEKVYVSDLTAAPDGSMELTIRTRASETIDQLSRNLTDAGYEVLVGRLSVRTDRAGFKYHTTVTLRPGADWNKESDKEIKDKAGEAA